MTWADFQDEKAAYQAVWKKIKEGAHGPMASFLKRSRLVVSCGRQFAIEDPLLTVAEACPAFFVPTPASVKLVEYARLLKRLQNSGSGDKNKPEMPIFSLDDILIVDRWRVEVSFPYVDIDLIQALKQSPYCDQEKTMMRPASTVVVLRKEIPHG